MRENPMGAMTPPSRKSCYNFRVIEINRVVDGDTIDVTIDLGFDLYKKERVRIAGVDTPEKRTRDLEEKALGIDATNWMKEKLEGAIDGDDDLDMPRTALADVEAARIFDPFSSSTLPLFHTRIPCCIHLGRFS
jgi:hypothetical protein